MVFRSAPGTQDSYQVLNSPCWTIHPYFSNHLKFIDVKIKAPADSHNTAPCPSLIQHCLTIILVVGTVGSEIAAGVMDVQIKDCLFMNTDRGLRVKTRRGRGKLSVLDDISFENIDMDNVMTPFVVNSFYFCDPDGKTEYVGSKKPLPVDDRTPSIKKFTFKNINAKNCHVAGTYICGLPESKIEELTFENINITYADNAKSGVAAMMLGCDEASRQGMIVSNINTLILDNVKVTGCDGEEIVAENVDNIIKK